MYEDTTATTDISAFLMGREPQRIESLRSLAMTRVPELSKYTAIGDLDGKDPIVVRVVDNDPHRLALVDAITKWEAVAQLELPAGKWLRSRLA